MQRFFSRITSIAILAFLALACSALPTQFVAADPIATPTQPGRISPAPSSVEPLKFETLGNGIGVSAFAQGAKIDAGGMASISILSGPMVVRVSRQTDGSIAAISTMPWTLPTVTEMQFCAVLDAPCELKGNWIPFASQHQVQLDADWIGTREFWVTAQFRNANGGIIPSFNDAANGLRETLQFSTRIQTTLAERTPLAAMPAKIQTFVAATRTAYPVTGFVKLESGRCCAGGKAGSTIEVKAEFGASSPFAEVKEMRMRDFRSRKCASDAEMSEAAWEPLIAQKNFRITSIPINWSSFDVSVQYRDADGRSSQIYCADLAIEGMP